MKRTFLPFTRLRLAHAGVFVALTLAGCTDVAPALGRTRPEARQHAGELTYALGARFGRVVPVEGFDQVRSQFSRSALTPTRLFRDSTIWTSSSADKRALLLGGRPEESRYVLGFRDLSKLSGALGETRRSVELHRLSGNDYEWAVRDDLVVGSVTPDQLGATLAALFRSAERTEPAAARAAVRSAFPRTATSLGRLASLDRIALERRPDGATRVAIEAAVHPGRIESAFPDYSRFLDRYLTRTRIALITEDATGVDWMRANLSGNRLTIELAVRGGALAPLEGPPRRIPNTLQARIDAATRVRIFGVGFSELVGDVFLTRRPDEKSFIVHFRREPEWHLPLLVAQFIRSPLRRPFEGDGATLGFSAARKGGSTVIARDYGVAVTESAIIRWIGDLGSTALGDFRLRAEAQHEQFIGEVFTAMRSDLDTLLR